MASILINHIDVIILIVSLVIMFVIGILMHIGIRNYYMLEKRYMDLKGIADDLVAENKKLSTRSSEDLLKYLRELVAQVSVIKFREYMDSHDINMITRENLKGLTSEISKEIYSGIKNERLKDLSRDTLMNENFYNVYIIHLAMNNVKQLLTQEIEAVAENQQ